ncbi:MULTISPECIES: DnaD domain-containing protein [Paenibacillus]|uniref:DNA replication protein DnaD n=1 Tax=Paenibacillus naphthalenovorans TaxID=162209 RepID=A0A0U2VKZ9_9BACL|nr:MULTISPECIES: DnaD domain protein [Paenibacillus]ALS21430.1 DNA replication protein DnaD [Paenibacillus naphthalenovorans]NTZ18397.1 DnaD domain protein [Paenibacillus sp. JMULE4]GCL72690.1 DNA replication protein DnaD [Paenibacillus naphthalenovorans]SDJ54715.1 DNA replication protein [Paenibacillus naphthalenovorans]
MRRSEQDTKELPSVLLAGWQEGNVNVPYWLLRYYTQLRLQEQDVMLILHVMAFKQKENKDFPTFEEIQSRMSIPQEKVIAVLQKLLKEGLLRIDEETDPLSAVHSEKYNWQPLMERLAECRLEELLEERAALRRQAGADASGKKDIFTIFEKEFGRPLTPMELESISGWMDKDGYPEELILAGLKEAVFAGKVHFRYIDRILLEWQRNRIKTVEQAKEHSQKFRAR